MGIKHNGGNQETRSAKRQLFLNQMLQVDAMQYIHKPQVSCRSFYTPLRRAWLQRNCTNYILVETTGLPPAYQTFYMVFSCTYMLYLLPFKKLKPDETMVHTIAREDDTCHISRKCYIMGIYLGKGWSQRRQQIHLPPATSLQYQDGPGDLHDL